MRHPKLLTVVRWLAVLPAAVLAGGAAGLAVTALYGVMPGEIGRT
jgi:hypothetical protein